MKKSLAILCLLLIGCSKTPDVPSLPGKAAPSIEQVIVGKEFSIQDARNVFNALNSNGKLSSLKKWFDLPESELKIWARFFDEYFYQEGLLPRGALSLLENRTARKGFLVTQHWVKNWQSSINYLKEKDAVFKVLKDNSLPQLAKQNVSFLEANFLETLIRSEAIVRSQYLEAGSWQETLPVPSAHLASDITKFLNSNPIALENLSQELKGGNFVENFLLSLTEQNKTYQSSLPFEGFSYGLGKRLSSKESQSLVAFLDFLNQPTNGIFSVAQKTLENNRALGRILGMRFDPMVARAAHQFILDRIQKPKAFWLGVVRKDLTGNPTPEFSTLLSLVVGGLNSLTSQGSSNSLVSQMPVFLASITLTERIEEILRTNHALISALPEEGFQEKLLASQISGVESSFPLAEFDENGKALRLHDKLAKDLSALPGIASVKEVLNTMVLQESFGSRIFNFGERGNGTFKEVLLNDILTIQDTHRIADVAGLLMPVLRAISTSSTSSFPLEAFESSNMLDSLNTILKGISLETWNTLDHYFFEVLKIGTLDEADKDLVLELYLNDKTLKERVRKFFDSIELLHTFHKSIQKNLPSSFSFYHQLLASTRSPKAEIHSIAALASFVHKTKLIGEDYPNFYSTLEQSKPIAKLLFQFSAFDSEERNQLVSTLNQTFSKELLEFINRFSSSHPHELAILIELLLKNGQELLPGLSSFPATEREWVIRFIQSEHFPPIWKFLKEHGSKEELRGILSDLRTLLQNGSLLDATRLLRRIQNPLLKHFSHVLEQMILAGELESLLQTIEGIIPDSH